MRKNIILLFLIVFITFLLIVNAKDPDNKKKDKKERNKTEQDKTKDNEKGSSQDNKIKTDFNLKNNDVIFFGNELLGKPTNSSITINIVPNKDVELYFEYGKKSKEYIGKTKIYSSSYLKPIEVTLENLEPDQKYYYRMNYKLKNDTKYISSVEHSFHTQRKTGEKFIFTVTADPHLDDKTDPELLKKSMISALSNTPDFHIDLGDNFMSDKLIDKSEENVIKRHLEMRYFFDLLSHSAPLFLVLGNHEGELGWDFNIDPNGLALWALNTRKLFYPNPIPNNFYSGNSIDDKKTSLREDYYAWEWGDALFVIIDPYWFTLSKPKTDEENWKWTLGIEQYQWFKTTLEKSKAKFKFVFSHQLVGGSNDGRGGVEFAKYFEQGGYNKDGTRGFDKQRPGWEKTLQEIMKENGVNIFFHGHDHFYAKQELDNIIYQLVPQPGNDSYQTPPYASEYGYKVGTILGNAGYLRITVSGTEVIVDFIQFQEEKKTGVLSEKIADSYIIKSRK